MPVPPSGLIAALNANPALLAQINDCDVADRQEAAKKVIDQLAAQGVKAAVTDLLDEQGQIPLNVAREVLTLGQSPGGNTGAVQGWRNQGSTTIPCPVMSTLFRIGAFKRADGHVAVSDLAAALRNILGLNESLVGFLVNGGRDAELTRLKTLSVEELTKLGYKTRPTKSKEVTGIDLFSLVGGSLDHSQDLAILTTKGLNEKAFADLRKFAALEGHPDTFTKYELAKMQEAAGDNDTAQSIVPNPFDANTGAARGNIAGLFEMAMLLNIFGTKDAEGELTLSIGALESLYLRHELPAGFTTPAGNTSTASIGASAASMWWTQLISPTAGVGEAIGKKPPLSVDNFRSVGGGVCPYMNAALGQRGVPTSSAVERAHVETSMNGRPVVSKN